MADFGAYPRVGGAARSLILPIHVVRGLSPRGRGSPADTRRPCCTRRPIPAWAGQPAGTTPATSILGAYPRVGGAARSLIRCIHVVKGLSPRGRGSRDEAFGIWQDWGPIPAWAGQPMTSARSSSSPAAYPRVGGAAPSAMALPVSSAGLSPRGRGSHTVKAIREAKDRPIPAWAGQPRDSTTLRRLSAAYPRVGGAAPLSFLLGNRCRGLSPRGRGSLAD